MSKWKTRVDGSPAQIGQKFQERARSYAYGARAGASGAAIPPQMRSVQSFKKPMNLDITYLDHAGKKHTDHGVSPKEQWNFWQRQRKGTITIIGVHRAKANPHPEPSDGYIRHRIRNPKKFDSSSFRTIEFDSGIKAVVGCPRGKFKAGRCTVGTRVQTILFPKDQYTIQSAKAWVKEHNQIRGNPHPKKKVKPREPAKPSATGKAYLKKFSTQELKENRAYFVSVCGKEDYERELKIRAAEKEFLQIVKRPSFKGRLDPVWIRVCKKHGLDPFESGVTAPKKQAKKSKRDVFPIGTYLGTTPGFRTPAAEAKVRERVAGIEFVGKPKKVELEVPKGMKQHTTIKEKSSAKNPFVITLGGEKRRLKFSIGRKGAHATYEKGNETEQPEIGG